MATQSVYTLINQQNGNLVFKVFEFDNNSYFDHIQRNNFFSLILITKGTGKAKVDFSEYNFGVNSLFSFYPYQPFMLSTKTNIEGFAIQFHHDFFCIHRHHKEISCNGILFNNIYQQPYIILDTAEKKTFLLLVDQIIEEIKARGLQHDEVIISYLKVVLIAATRIKVEQQQVTLTAEIDSKQLFVLQNLKDAIEENFRLKHSAGEYALLLNLSTNALAKITKTYFNKTISDLIAERIIIEAKRELYLTKKTIKEIAYELGYEDEYYFSRFFKVNAEISPQQYRDTVGFNRGEN
jgi:AraC family transcriptional regulator, transcriptional activator of pobA